VLELTAGANSEIELRWDNEWEGGGWEGGAKREAGDSNVAD